MDNFICTTFYPKNQRKACSPLGKNQFLIILRSMTKSMQNQLKKSGKLHAAQQRLDLEMSNLGLLVDISTSPKDPQKVSVLANT
jgi:hypothetical protein